MAADAFTNPDYMRYAVKTLLACLICYTFYSGVDWEGIHTCMLTCVIVANPNVGSSYQKMVLRFGGAFCGAILALFIHATGHALAGQYCRIAVCAGTDFPVGRMDCHQL
ncbi:multidrug efflux system protein MdtO [Escherichia coli]|uniref:Multidrug efflux system protein MdtO n=1 Tax=Escherichia coli TaxID=562 RepID=A0A376TPV7_ECOLX|nr:multidrug efflux system protein MdtO [Escherichia coli]